MDDWLHSDGLDRQQRLQRERAGNCPVCGDPFDGARRVIENGQPEGDWAMLGLAYDHGDTECIEWASGVTQRYDPTNDKIIQ